MLALLWFGVLGVLVVGHTNLMQTTITCYNTPNPTPSGCPAASVTAPINRRTVFSYLPDVTGLQAETDIQYHSNLETQPSELDSYDYGPGAVGPILQKVITTYGVFSNASLPSSVEIQNGSSAQQSLTSYLYDQTSVTATTGTPQHTTISGARGNLTSVARKVSGTVTLYQRVTYYDTGNANTVTDWGTTSAGGPQITTFIYDNTGSPAHACGNSFATSVSEPLSLSRFMTWNCSGGVMTSATDENGKTAAVIFSDPFFWRPASMSDQLTPANSTTFSYSANLYESSLLFNSSNAIVDHRLTLDAFGLPSINQVPQSPAATAYDSFQVDHDGSGRMSDAIGPYSAAAGASCSGTCPVMTFTYDALGRLLTSTDAASGTVANIFTKNDVLQTIGPAPTGESTKKKQFEYDALGRLTSVCEITSGIGSGTCGQTVSQAGYWTKYVYDALGRLTGVTQNAQASPASQQTRIYAFDMISRLTSESNPESGSTSYSYDALTSDPSCNTVSSPGDLVKKLDAAGNVTCFAHDALHRVSSVTYPTGPYSASTQKKFFVYDAATGPGSVAMANAKTRLAEAYTCTGACSSSTTDLFFSYSARGEVTDVWQSSTNSGGYYHLAGSYWANGAPNSLSGLPSVPTFTYGLDGEGRVKTMSASSGQNPVTNTAYNVASQVTGVTLGSSDNDSFTYDPNSGRMTQYQFSVGATPQTLTANLTWNSNGTLQTMAITDQLNAINTQTCSFRYDDLARLAGRNANNFSVDCGATWQQAFTLDPFGNLTKSGSVSFLPTYSTTTNRYSNIPGGSVSYDANGNLTNDVGHSYSWDANEKLLSVDGSTVTLLYDALGRMVEQARGSVKTQIVYSPLGEKVALMNGQTLTRAFISLTGRAKAVYTSSGLAYYRHSDYLGSSRLATNPSRVKYYDVAYAPYGEDYAGSGTQDPSFTDQQQDTVVGGSSTGLYDFLFRQYRPSHGRWISPDPAGIAATKVSDPQSWNLYSYVGNNPVDIIDPQGLSWQDGLPLGIHGSWAQSLHPESPFGGGGGGGGSVTCIWDGVESDCGLVAAAVDSGAASVCPNGCSAVGLDGRPVHFFAPVNGPGGYYPYSGPGTLYYSPQQAGAAAALQYEKASIQEKREYGGTVYVDANGIFSYSEADVGPVCLESGSTCEDTIDLENHPSGTVVVASYHTHPDEWGGYSFSTLDITQDDAFGLIGFLGTPPVGRVLMYDPSQSPPICSLRGPAQGLLKCH